MSSVDAEGPAFDKGIKAGDIILEVSGDVVITPDDVESRIAKMSDTDKKTVLMLIKSTRGKRFVALSLRKA